MASVSDALADFALLAEPGRLGFYRRAQITTAFLCRDKAHVLNYYTLVVLEDAEIPSERVHFLTESPLSIPGSAGWHLGVVTHYESVAETRARFESTLAGGAWKLRGREMRLPPLRLLPKVFVPPHDKEGVPLNAILKNNSHRGSYVIEFFDEAKVVYASALGPDGVDFVNDRVTRYIPVDLNVAPDRAGSVVFQLPNDVVATHERLDCDTGTLTVDVAYHPRLASRPTLCAVAVHQYDGLVAGFGCSVVTGEPGKADLHDVVDSPVTFVLYDTSSRLVYAAYSGSFMKHGITVMHDIHDTPRVIRHRGTETHIELFGGGERAGAGPRDYREAVRRRQVAAEARKLTADKSLMQFGQRGKPEHDLALAELRGLVENHYGRGICLWDPYLTYEDLVETLYYAGQSRIPLRAIGSFDSDTQSLRGRGRWTSFEGFQKEQVAGFESSGSNTELDLEFRCRRGQRGWDFHDRFLILLAPDPDEQPGVWSLGTSVNSLGKSHHIIQKVPNGRVVLAAFDSLWDALSSPDCLVWKSRP